MSIILEAFQMYYGIDWLAFVSGLIGMYLISEKNRWGFLLNFIACCSGFYVAAVSYQFGFVFYNFVLVFLMMRGFKNWEGVETQSQPVRAYAEIRG